MFFKNTLQVLDKLQVFDFLIVMKLNWENNMVDGKKKLINSWKGIKAIYWLSSGWSIWIIVGYFLHNEKFKVISSQKNHTF